VLASTSFLNMVSSGTGSLGSRVNLGSSPVIVVCGHHPDMLSSRMSMSVCTKFLRHLLNLLRHGRNTSHVRSRRSVNQCSSSAQQKCAANLKALNILFAIYCPTSGWFRRPVVVLAQVFYAVLHLRGASNEQGITLTYLQITIFSLRIIKLRLSLMEV
jgi:hypothetical protein